MFWALSQEVQVKAEPVDEAEPGATEGAQAGDATNMETSKGAAGDNADEHERPPMPARKPGVLTLRCTPNSVNLAA